MDAMVDERAEKPVRERQNGIDRAVEILDALLRLRAPAKIGDLAKSIGAPRSTLYSIISRLTEAGIIEAAGEEGQIYFGQAVHLYGRAYADANPLHRRCREALERLAAQTNATAQLCALRGNKYVVVDVRDGSGVFKITTDIGVEVPIPWTASGRLLLDHMPASDILKFVPREDFRLPDGRMIEADAFVGDIARARTQGHCMTNGLSDPFTCCLAAPIRDRRGVAVATLCFIVPIDSPDARKSQLLDLLVSAAAELSDR
jgi:DNA-binding IclR family transcriptional regulator